MARPTILPRWATDGGTTTTPNSGRQDTGYGVGEPPAAKVHNWLFNLIYTWLSWLNDITASSSGNRYEGVKLLQTYALVTDLPGSSGAVNREVAWVAETMSFYGFITGSTATADGGNVISVTGGRWFMIGAGANWRNVAYGVAGLNSAGKVPNANTTRGDASGLAGLGSDSLVLDAHLGAKRSAAHGSAEATSATLRTGSFNVASLSHTGTPKVLRVTFTTALPNANYTVALSINGTPGNKGAFAVRGKTTTYFDIGFDELAVNFGATTFSIGPVAIDSLGTFDVEFAVFPSP